MVKIYFLIWIILQVASIYWMLKAKPDKEIMAKYPKNVFYMFLIPFNNKWKSFVEKTDLEILEKYLYRINIWYMLLVIPFFVLFVYFGVGIYYDFQNFSPK